MRSMAGLLSLLVGVCSGGAGVQRQEPSKWVVDLKAPLVNAYEETNERGQVLQLGEREISFKLTQPADSVVVEVLFVTYAGIGSPAYLRYDMTERYPYPADWNEVKCSDTMGIPVWRKKFHRVQAESVVVATWDYLWDEELIRGFQVAPWAAEAYGAGLTKADAREFVIVETAVPHRGRGLTCNEWLPDPYRPNEIWATWRHDGRGSVVRGGYEIRTVYFEEGPGNTYVHTSQGFGLAAKEDWVGRDRLLEQARQGVEHPFWGWYHMPTVTQSNWYYGGGAETELRLMEGSEE